MGTPTSGPPWPLTKAEIEKLAKQGLLDAYVISGKFTVAPDGKIMTNDPPQTYC